MQTDTPKPDQVVSVTTKGHTVKCYRYGAGAETLLCLNGGPGLPCDYLRDSHAHLADDKLSIVAFDQLGTGLSDHPDDPALWTIERYVDEVEAVRRDLDLGRVHLLGHSWGGWLAIEYSLRYQAHLKSLVLANTCADMPHLIGELERLRGALGSETVAMMRRHEAEETWTHPEYQAAITLLNYRHVCRLGEWPAALRRSLDNSNAEIYRTMQGPNEFHYTGNLKGWTRVDQLADLSVPTLITVGQHDELTPGCALRMKQALPDATLRVFPNSAHVPFFEEPGAYFPVLQSFIERNSRGPSA